MSGAMQFFRCVLGKVSCSFSRNSNKNSGIGLEVFLNHSKEHLISPKTQLKYNPISLKIRDIRWLQIFSRVVQKNSFRSKFWLENSWLWLHTYYLQNSFVWNDMTCQSLVNFAALVWCMFAKNGEKMLTGHFLTNPSKIHI